MAKTTLFKGIVYLSQEQYNKLIALGAIEVDGNIIEYDESTVYVTPQVLPDDYYTKEQTKELIKNQVVSGDEFIIVGEGEIGTINEGKSVIELDRTNIEIETATENSEKLITSGAVFNSLSASGGSKLYEHNITINNVWALKQTFLIYNTDSTSFTNAMFAKWLYDRGHTNQSNMFYGSGNANQIRITNNKIEQCCLGYFSSNGTVYQEFEKNITFNSTLNEDNSITNSFSAIVSFSNQYQITDTVIEV